jgi:hypothetical protein
MSHAIDRVDLGNWEFCTNEVELSMSNEQALTAREAELRRRHRSALLPGPQAPG